LGYGLFPQKQGTDMQYRSFPSSLRFVSAACAAAMVSLAVPAAAQSTPAQAPAVDVKAEVGDLLTGAFFRVPEGTGPFPAIIILGGSEGGNSAARQKAPWFLAQGYAVLGLPYYSPSYISPDSSVPGLPEAFHDIPIDRLETALAWLRAQADVRADRIGLYGVSKGAEFALAGASRIDGFAAVVAIVPSDVIWEGWGPGTVTGKSSGFSWRGAPLPFVPFIEMNAEIAKLTTPGATARIRTPQDAGRKAFPETVPAATIAVEAIDEPVLVAGSDKDNTWASGEMAQAIAQRRAAAGLTTVSLIFGEAGHGLAGTGERSPETASWYSEADLAAQSIIWPTTLAFLAQNLKDSAKPAQYPGIARRAP